MIDEKLIRRFRVKPGSKVRLKDYDPGWAQTKDLKALGKQEVKKRSQEILVRSIHDLATAQELLYASDTYSVLVVLQAMDAAGKDGVIKHVMTGVNPQGCQVNAFKAPSREEVDHDFLWRYAVRLPERGHIGIFNRSYYEDVLVVRVHPEMLDAQRLPPGKRGRTFWEDRYASINGLERHLARNGTLLLKFFLHVSKKEQKRRFLKRLNDPKKHWKFSDRDLVERQFWDSYVEAYEAAIAATSTEWAPWHIVPADDKWATRAIVADILTTTIRSLKLEYPEVTSQKRVAMKKALRTLENER